MASIHSQFPYIERENELKLLPTTRSHPTFQSLTKYLFYRVDVFVVKTFALCDGFLFGKPKYIHCHYSFFLLFFSSFPCTHHTYVESWQEENVMWGRTEIQMNWFNTSLKILYTNGIAEIRQIHVSLDWTDVVLRIGGKCWIDKTHWFLEEFWRHWTSVLCLFTFTIVTSTPIQIWERYDCWRWIVMFDW